MVKNIFRTREGVYHLFTGKLSICDGEHDENENKEKVANFVHGDGYKLDQFSERLKHTDIVEKGNP